MWRFCVATKSHLLKPGMRNDVEDVYSGWPSLAGYFDGDGTVEFSVRIYTLHIRLAFDENWKPHLDAVKRFLESRGIRAGLVRKKESFNTWHVVVSNTSGVVEMAKKLMGYCTKKRDELKTVMDYYFNRITGDEFVERMNEFVSMGERTGKVKEGGPPFTRAQGRELSAIASHINGRTTRNLKKSSVAECPRYSSGQLGANNDPGAESARRY